MQVSYETICLEFCRRFSAAVWALAPDAQILDPEEAVTGRDRKSFLMMLLLEGPLLEEVAKASFGRQSRRSKGRAAGRELDQALLKASTESSLLAFEQAAARFRRGRQLHMSTADICSWALLPDPTGADWWRLYQSAILQTDFNCPVLVWHPRRCKMQVLSCQNVDKFSTALERLLDGTASFVEQQFPSHNDNAAS